jgi:asparagine N-glycosylation enzyme membrane subunit Stt3
MKEMKATIDNWKGINNQSSEYLINNEEYLISLLKKLDENIHTQLILESDDGFLLIGGGNNSFVISCIIGENESSFTLVNGTDENDVEVVTGGQAGLFPQKMVVNYEIALNVITYYFKTSKMDSHLTWKED